MATNDYWLLVIDRYQVKREFSFSLFDLDWEVFSVNIEGAINRVPDIEKTGIKSTVCGPGQYLNHLLWCIHVCLFIQPLSFQTIFVTLVDCGSDFVNWQKFHVFIYDQVRWTVVSYFRHYHPCCFHRASAVLSCAQRGVMWNKLTLWWPLLPYGYSYKASCARPG